MPFYLSNLLQRAYAKLGQANYSTATGGTTATVLDSKQATLHGDGTWANGAVFIVRDAAGAGAAPENEYALLTGYTDSTGTFTSAASSYTVTPAAGDVFMFCNDFYPLFTMIELANAALQSLGPIPLIDTSLTSDVSKTEYDVPVALKRRPPVRVDYQGRTNDADDNQWIEIRNWRYEPATAGTVAKLVIPQLPDDRTIRVWYEGVHPELKVYNSAVVESIEPELAAQVLTEKALEWQNTRLQGGDEFLIQRWNDQKNQVMQAKADFEPSKPRRKARLLIVGTVVEEDQFDYPDPV